jgi:hypothetical protein
LLKIADTVHAMEIITAAMLLVLACMWITVAILSLHCADGH